MAVHPIFIHSLFRTGSTYIWNKFRQSDTYYCYYEPFHQGLAELTAGNIENLLTKDFESVNHPRLTKYYLHEYKPLLQDGCPGLPYFKKSFSFDEFCYKDAENPDLKKYIDYLIAGAGEKIPVLQFNRSSLRIKWFKKYYPNALNIYLVRNPGDQWISYFEVMRKAKERIFFVMDILTAGLNAGTEDFKQLSTRIPLIDYHQECFENEIKIYRLIEPYYSLEEKYAIFYYTWLKSLIENVLNADFVLNMNRLSQDTPYRRQFENLIFNHSETVLDCYDAKIREYDHSPISRDIMTAVETEVQQVIFCSDKRQKKQLVKKLKKEGDNYLPIKPLEINGVKEIPNFSFLDSGHREKFKHLVLLLADKYLNYERKWLESRANNEANKKVIHNLEYQLTQTKLKLMQSNQQKQEVELQLQEQKKALERILSSLSWRLTFPLRWMNNKVKPIHRRKNNQLNAYAKKKIAIDVTPVLPGGDNGGIKLLLWELLKRFNNSENEDFILLTAAKNHYLFDEFNMKRICVSTDSVSQQARIITRVFNRVKRKLKPGSSKGVLKKNGISVLFCPFAALTYGEIGIPTVSIIADLQHLYYPFFFSKQELKNRNHFYERLRTKANYIIAISEYTRKTIIEKLNFSPAKVYVIPISIQSRLQVPPPASIQTMLEKYALYNKKYCIYPANLWPHKNHKMLITAFAMFQKKYPAYDLHLVLTGAQIRDHDILNDSIKQMGIDSSVHFTGFLPGEELAVIWSRSYFLIYPSLFEGFGIPLVEAMRYKKPILAGNVTSIPEVAGDAALYFDPKEPDQIVNSIQRIMEDTSLYDLLVKKGQEQLKKYNPDEMVDRYLQILHKACEPSTLLRAMSQELRART